MKVAILTTETPHHVYFVREVAKRFPVARVFRETQKVFPSFETAHPYEDERERFERGLWFGDTTGSLNEFAETQSVVTMNDPYAVQALDSLQPDAVVVFGTGRLKQPVIAVQPERMFNLHGGDPERYRGLDTHLWAIYHNDFPGLVTTLHRVTPVLDNGDIVSQAPLALARGMLLKDLRAANTRICVTLTLAALSQLAERGVISSRPQAHVGRYYSFMPTVLKDLVCKKFAAHTAKLHPIALVDPA